VSHRSRHFFASSTAGTRSTDFMRGIINPMRLDSEMHSRVHNSYGAKQRFYSASFWGLGQVGGCESRRPASSVRQNHRFTAIPLSSPSTSLSRRSIFTSRTCWQGDSRHVHKETRPEVHFFCTDCGLPVTRTILFITSVRLP
jgi:hypothetical protein